MTRIYITHPSPPSLNIIGSGNDFKMVIWNEEHQKAKGRSNIMHSGQATVKRMFNSLKERISDTRTWRLHYAITFYQTLTPGPCLGPMISPLPLPNGVPVNPGAETHTPSPRVKGREPLLLWCMRIFVRDSIFFPTPSYFRRVRNHVPNYTKINFVKATHRGGRCWSDTEQWERCESYSKSTNTA